MDWTTLDWTDMSTKISNYFTVGEATYLSSWQIYHTPSDQEKENLVAFTAQLDQARGLIGIPFIVHCMIRPISVNCPGSQYDGQNYNAFVGSIATKSAHISGRACDFNVKGYASAANCEQMREVLVPYLESLNLRMEKPTGSGTWLHLDNYPVVNSRYFQP